MSIRKEFESWKKQTNSHGRMAYPRFIMFKFLESLNDVSDQFVFKGGNLLWFYIKTPRPTIDLDLSTSTKLSMDQFRAIVDEINSKTEGLVFKITNAQEIISEVKVGLKLDVEFRDDSGGSNKFGIDIVFGVPTDFRLIEIHKKKLNAASVENIIADKLMACHSFGAGNTRAKDYDDLFRLAIDDSVNVDKGALRHILKERDVEPVVKTQWLNEQMQTSWERHLKKAYRRKNDLPENLEEVFEVINSFLSKIRS